MEFKHSWVSIAAEGETNPVFFHVEDCVVVWKEVETKNPEWNGRIAHNADDALAELIPNNVTFLWKEILGVVDIEDQVRDLIVMALVAGADWYGELEAHHADLVGEVFDKLVEVNFRH